MQSQQDAEAAAPAAPAEVVPNSSSAVTVVKPMIDLGTMQDDGLISAQDAQQYLAYRQIVEHAHKYGIFNKMLQGIFVHCFTKTNIFCIYLLLPEAYSKLMKDCIMKPRSIIKYYKPNSAENPTLTGPQQLILEEAEKMLEELTEDVGKTVQGLIARIEEAYKALDKDLFAKYEMRYYMVISSLKKIHADFLRYYAEKLTGDARAKQAQQAKEAYEQAYEGFLKLPQGIKGPQALSCQLNYTVLLCDVCNQVDEAIECAENLLREIGLTIKNADFNNAVTISLLQVIKENLTQWQMGRDEKNLYDSSSDEDNDSDEQPAQPVQRQKIARSKTVNTPAVGTQHGNN